MPEPEIVDLVAARRRLDTRARTAAADAGSPSRPDRATARDALAIGAALVDQRQLRLGRTWLDAAARVAPPGMLAEVGDALVDAAALPEAEAALRRGAATGDVESCLHLGRFLLLAGRREEADRWLRSATAADPEKARALLSDLRVRHQDDVADHWATVAAEMGDAAAAVRLAKSAAGRGDDAAAERWFEWAEQLGQPGVAMERLGLALERDDQDGVRRWTAVAADEGHVVARRELGLRLLDEGEATAGWWHLRQAAEGGDVRAQLRLAARAGEEGDRGALVDWMLEAAHADPRTAAGFADTLESAGHRDLAVRLLRVCVDGGHDASRVPLGRLLVALGEPAEAVEVVRPAAEAGLPEGGVLLGLAEEQRGRLDQARYAYRRAAADGDGRAARKLGTLDRATGDEAAARRWFLRGARAGEAGSLFHLADMEPEAGRAARWLVLAAAHGHGRAALQVGMAEATEGRATEGVRWLRRAVELGEPRAAEVLAAVLRGSAP